VNTLIKQLLTSKNVRYTAKEKMYFLLLKEEKIFARNDLTCKIVTKDKGYEIFKFTKNKIEFFKVIFLLVYLSRTKPTFKLQMYP
jgi:hypothetical protein